MGCVVWSKVGMTVEDTIHIGDGSTHCDVPTTLARNIYNGSVANDVPVVFSSAYILIEVLTINHSGVLAGGTYIGHLARVVSF